MTNYFREVRHRILNVRMLHIGLGSDLWHLIDIWYVITGRV